MNYLIIIFYLFVANPTTEKSSLTITVSNIESLKGTLEIALFDKSERFLEEGQALKSVSVKVERTSETIVIKDLPKGTYAISMYHDKNSDGKCNLNFFGIPTEPYAFSNNFRPKLSAPTFKDCEFALSSNKKLTIELKN